MSLSIKGKITKILPVDTGSSKVGKEWKRQSFVIDTGSDYQPEICFGLFGEDKIAILTKYPVGSNVNVCFNVSSRDFNGKYYHNIDAWKIDASSEGENTTAPVASSATTAADIDDEPPF